jgi:peptidoglycan/LPS O-acetylase OafA/YrhL
VRVVPEIAAEARLAHFDGLRGVAILMVLACHTLDHSLGLPAVSTTPAFWNLVVSGRHGVDLFFVLSAWTIFHSSYDRFRLEPDSTARFFLRRAFRIFPPWWAACFAYGALKEKTFLGLLPHLFIFPGLAAPQLFHVEWSIFVEAVFYLTLPFLFLRVTSLKRALGSVALAYCFYWAWLGIAYTWLEPLQLLPIERFPLSFAPCFAFGILVFFIRPERLPSLRAWIELGAVALLGVALTAAEWLLPAALALFCLLSGHPATWLGKIARSKWLGRFGRGAYSIYLFHLILFYFLDPFKERYLAWLDVTQIPAAFLAWFPITAGASLILGLVGYYGLERPSVLAGRKLIQWLFDASWKEKSSERFGAPLK